MAAQALVLRFDTDLSQAQRNIANFATQTGKNLFDVHQAAIKTRDTLELLSKVARPTVLAGIAVGALAAVGAIRAFSAAVEAAQASIADLTKIGADAAKAGVGTTFFQSYTQQAEEFGHEVSDLTAQLEKFREASTTTIGEDGGPAKNAGRERIQRNVLAGHLAASAISNFNAADTSEARARVVLGLLDELERKGLQLARFDLGRTFFGASFETDLRNGVDAIGRMRAGLDGLKAAGGTRIIPPEEIARAQQMKAEIDEINNRLAAAMKPVMEQIVKIQQQMLEGWTSSKLFIIQNISVVTTLLNAVQSVVDGLRVARAAVKDALGLPVELPFPRPQGHPGTELPAAPALTVHGDRSKSLPSLTPPAARAGPVAAQLDQVENYIKSLQKLVAVEQAEAATLGLGNRAKQEAVDLARAMEAARERGTPLTQKEKEQVAALADAYIAAKDKIEAFAKAKTDLDKLRDSALAFTDRFAAGLVQVAIHGGKVQDVLRGILGFAASEVLRGLLRSLIGAAFPEGGKGGGGLLSLLPKFAEGGDLPSGHFGIAGERGPELIAGPASITPFRQINAALDSSGGRSAVAGNQSRTFNIDARGAQVGVADQIVSALERYDRRLSRNLPTKLALANRRFG